MPRYRYTGTDPDGEIFLEPGVGHVIPGDIVDAEHELDHPRMEPTTAKPARAPRPEPPAPPAPTPVDEPAPAEADPAPPTLQTPEG